MKKMVRGAIAILALSGLSGCVDDPLLDLNTEPVEVRANPIVLNVKQGDSSAVLLRLINPLNNGVRTSFTISGAGAGIAVHYDPLYRPEYVDGSDTLIVPLDKSQQRYFVLGVTPGEYTYTASAGGLSGTFKVRVEPTNLGAALSRTTGVAGDEVTITAPNATRFTQTATVTFATGSNAISSRSADGKTIKVLVGPGVTGAATVAGVTMDYLTAAGNLTLASTNTMTTPALLAAPTTLSSATPNIGAPVTVTLGGSVRFRRDGKVLIGGVEAGITALSADSSTATIVPALGSSGDVTYTGVALSFLSSVALALPSDGKTIVPTATFGGPTYAGADAFATAPTVVLPTVIGQSLVTTDNGSTWGTPSQCTALGLDNCRIYKIVVPAGQTFDVLGRWNSDADMGIVRFTSTFTGAYVADNLGQDASRSEHGALTNLTAGTYYIGTGWFDYGTPPLPSIVQLIIKRTN
ncbi:MAG: hypothetical protein IPJ11_01780 [Gemmatimonadetes bacterium]|nr:hypothetical protein [Gemmatimonadota bacterium]